MFGTNRRLSVTGNILRSSNIGHDGTPRTVKSRTAELSNLFGPGAMGGAGNSSMNVYASGPLASVSMLNGLIPEQEDYQRRYFRDIYYLDAIAGTSVDLMSTFPFSEYTLTGLDNDKLEKFAESLERLNIRSLMPAISTAYLVDGSSISSLIFNQKEKIFVDLVMFSVDNCTITQLPFFSTDPSVLVKNTTAMIEFMRSNDQQARAVTSLLPEKLRQTFASSAFKLDPLTTLYLSRKTLPGSEPISFLKRMLPIYLLEKTLFRGTIVEANKRQRSMLHVTMGDDLHTFTPEEMAETVNQFQLADLDPLGAVIGTRGTVAASEIRQGGDFWKWTDTIDTLTPYKLRALGISEAFLSGDSNFSNCLVADTLIPTDKGLLTIGSLGTGMEINVVQTIDINVVSRYGTSKAVGWLYNGFRPTLCIHTAALNSIQCTGNHPILVYAEGRADWVLAETLKVGDLLCGPPVGRTFKELETFTEAEYELTPITRIVDGGPQHVYDISMRKGVEPAFVANGLIVHNTETALSVFLENLDAYRSYLTYEVFTNKIFPIVAIANDFFKKGKEVDTTKRRTMNYQANNHKDLEIPVLQWHKRLEAKDEENIMETLGALSEKGFPIPLRMWATAAKVDLNAYYHDLQQDKEIREAIAKYSGIDSKKIGASNEAGDEGESSDSGEDEDMEFAHLHDWTQPVRKQNLLNRNFGPKAGEVVGRTKTGKPTYILNQRKANAEANLNIAKAMTALSKPGVKEEALRKVRSALGHIPNIIGEPLRQAQKSNIVTSRRH